MPKARSRRAVLLVPILLCGCYAYGIRDLPRVPARSRLAVTFHPYTVKLRGGAFHQTKGKPGTRVRYEDIHLQGEAASRRVLTTAYDYLEDSGLFRDVLMGAGSVYDVALEVQLVWIIDPDRERWTPWLATLSTLTLTALPVWSTSQFILDVEATTISRERIFSQQYPVRIRTVFWLPLAAVRLFVYPDPNEELRNAARLALRDFARAETGRAVDATRVYARCSSIPFPDRLVARTRYPR